jgi:hypothetical protein
MRGLVQVRHAAWLVAAAAATGAAVWWSWPVQRAPATPMPNAAPGGVASGEPRSTAPQAAATPADAVTKSGAADGVVVTRPAPAPARAGLQSERAAAADRLAEPIRTLPERTAAADLQQATSDAPERRAPPSSAASASGSAIERVAGDSLAVSGSAGERR